MVKTGNNLQWLDRLIIFEVWTCFFQIFSLIFFIQNKNWIESGLSLCILYYFATIITPNNSDFPAYPYTIWQHCVYPVRNYNDAKFHVAVIIVDVQTQTSRNNDSGFHDHTRYAFVRLDGNFGAPPSERDDRRRCKWRRTLAETDHNVGR